MESEKNDSKEEKIIKILTISDHPLSPSGVGIQTKNMIEGLLETKKFKFVSIGGAMKHHDYNPIKTEQWGDDWVIFPVDGYGDEPTIRSVLRTEKPDILWFMTDPRFYEWLWMIENEIRPNVPMVYYHVWDNYPYPHYNKKFYNSNDVVVSISKLTDDIVRTVAPDVDCHYLPHAVDTDIFKKREINDAKENTFQVDDDTFVCFWNNRNARRKQSGTLVWWFKDFLDKIGRDKAVLIMHTDPKDEHGQDLVEMVERLGITEGEIKLSTQKLPPEVLSQLYNAADLTINIADAEGFGLATFESLACETPILVNMTGGLQEQVTDGENWFGIGLEPASKAIIGSQQVPYIYEDRLNREQFISALEELYNTWKDDPETYEKMGKLGREHVLKNYSFENYKKQWQNILTDVYEKYGSWKNREDYKSWELTEV